MLYTVALASAPLMLLENSQLRRPTAKFLIALSAAVPGKKMSFTRVLGKMTKEQEKLWEVVSKLNLYAPHKET